MRSMRAQQERNEQIKRELAAWIAARFRDAQFTVREGLLTRWVTQPREIISAAGDHFDVVSFEPDWEVINRQIREATDSQFVQEVAQRPGEDPITRFTMHVDEGRILAIQRWLTP